MNPKASSGFSFPQQGTSVKTDRGKLRGIRPLPLAFVPQPRDEGGSNKRRNATITLNGFGNTAK